MSSTTLFLLQEKKEKERKETKKVKLGSSFSVKKKKNKEVGSLFSAVHVVFCCSRRLRTPTIVKSYN